MYVPASQPMDGTGVGGVVGRAVGAAVRFVPPPHVQHMSSAVKSESSKAPVQRDA